MVAKMITEARDIVQEVVNECLEICTRICGRSDALGQMPNAITFYILTVRHKYKPSVVAEALNRHHDCPQYLHKRLAQTFEQLPVAYRKCITAWNIHLRGQYISPMPLEFNFVCSNCNRTNEAPNINFTDQHGRPLSSCCGFEIIIVKK